MASATTKLIPLNKLAISANNVRKAKTSKAEDDELYASLRHHGLKQNLLVHAVGDEFHVHAGGRRLTQLHRLAKDGHIKPDFKIPCRVEAAAVAQETSLVENSLRSAMSPADQLEAFARLIDGGSTVEEVATRFGVTAGLVERRLKLARVAPEIIEDLREGKMTLETVMAFTLSNDHARQLEVREAVSHLHAGGVHHTVRRMLTDHAQSGNSRLARYVGVDKYKAAGGPIIEDLFSDEGSVLLEDGALLKKLAVAKLERAAKKQGKGWKWSEAVLDFDYSAGLEYGRVYPEPQDLDPEIAEERETLRQRQEELDDLDNDDWTEALEHEADRAAERIEEITRIEEDSAVYSDAQRAIAGCIVTLDYQGAVTIEAGLVRPEDIPADESSDETNGEDGEAAGGDEEVSGKSGSAAGKPAQGKRSAAVAQGKRSAAVAQGKRSAAVAQGKRSAAVAQGKRSAAVAGDSASSVVVAPPRSAKMPPAPVDPVTAVRKEKGISQSLADDLRATRHQIVQAHLSADYDTAFDAMLYCLCRQTFGNGYEAMPLDVTLKPATVTGSRDVLQESIAAAVLSELHGSLCLEWLGKPRPEDFEAMAALEDSDKRALFAWCTAHALDQQLSTDSRADPVFEHLGRRMSVDVAKFWRPTVETYWGRVKKDHSLDVARDLIGDDWVADRSHYKKALLAKSMEAYFADDAGKRVGMSPQASAKTAAWLPDGMSFADEVGEDQADAAAETDAGTRVEASTIEAEADAGASEDEQGADPETAQSPAEDDESPDAGGLPDFLREHVAIVHVGGDGEVRTVDPVEALLSGKPGGSPAVVCDAVPRRATKSPMGDAAE